MKTVSHTRGIALVAVLWILGLLAMIAVAFVTTMRTETVVARGTVVLV